MPPHMDMGEVRSQTTTVTISINITGEGIAKASTEKILFCEG